MFTCIRVYLSTCFDVQCAHPIQTTLESEETMAVRTSSAEWKGTLKEGSGTMRVGSGAYEGPFTYASRFETGPGTNPEELVGAAHAGCFSMFLSALLTGAGFTPPTRYL